MKLLVMSLLISGASQWMTSLVTAADDGKVVEKKVIIMKGDGTAGDGKVVVFCGGDGADCYTGDSTVGDGDGSCLKHKVIVKTIGAGGAVGADGNVNVWHSADGQTFTFSGDGADGEPGAHVVFVADGAGAAAAGDGRSEGVRVVRVGKTGEDANHGWLGVSITSVSEALAAQLNLDGEGVVVQNVVDGSPADEAGLLAHDVIVSVDGEAIENDATGLVAAIKAHESGDVVSLVVLRDGRERNIDATLGTRAGSGAALEWKFDVAPDADIEEAIHTYGKMVRKSADGTWTMENLGELDDLENLPHNIRMMLPKSGNRTMQLFANGANSRIRTEVRKDGNVIIIEQEGGGEIKVTRVDDQGVKTTETYADGDALADADEEAFEVFDSSAKPNVFRIDTDGADGEGVQFKFDVDAEDFGDHFGTWEVNIEKSLDAAREAYDTAMHELKDMRIEMKDGKGFTFKPGDLKFFGDGDGAGEAHALRFGSFGKPKHTFELKADGSIDVRIRVGDSELLRQYVDVDDLADRDPKLYEKYEKILDVEDDE